MMKTTLVQRRNWEGKKVAILGFGREGQAMADYLLTQGAVLTICDEREAEQLDGYQSWQGRSVSWNLGNAYLKGLENFPIIIRSPGVLLSLPDLKKAVANGAEVTSLTKLFFELCPAPIIGVTGTKGKGTTATLIAKMLKRERRNVCLVGNIGVPAMSVLLKIKKTDWVVYELSSFQLQDMTSSPQIAVVLGITVDHQDYHKNPREYFDAKSNIFIHQRPTEAVIFNADYPETRRLETQAVSKVFHVSREHSVNKGSYVRDGRVFRKMGPTVEAVIDRGDIGLKGAHNLENITAAVVAATLAGANLSAIRKAIKTLKGLPHRLEPLATMAGIQYWNNSYAATPEAAIASVRSFTEPLVLLLGGSDRGHTFEALSQAIVESTVKAIVGIGTTAPKMYAAVKKAAKAKGVKPPAYVDGGETMPEMLVAARKFVKPGDVVLLSPGAPSFDHFKNYTERGELFRAAVNTLSSQ